MLLLLLMLATASRIYNLDHRSLGENEIAYALACHAGSVWDLITDVSKAFDVPPAYPVLLCSVVSFLGDSEFALRLLSVVSGILTIIFFYLLGRRFLSPTTGLLAAAWIAVSEPVIVSNQTANSYSLLAAMLAGHFYFFCSLIIDPSGRNRSPLGFAVLTSRNSFSFSWVPRAPFSGALLIGFWLTGVTAIYTSYTAWIFFLAELVVFCLFFQPKENESRMRFFVLIYGPILAAILFWVPTLDRYYKWVSTTNIFDLSAVQNTVELIKTQLLACSIMLIPCFLAASVVLAVLFKHGDSENKRVRFIAASLCAITIMVAFLLFQSSPYIDGYLALTCLMMLIALFSVGFIIDLIPSPVVRQFVVLFSVSLIVIFQIKYFTKHDIYNRQPDSDFKKAALIIKNDVDFMSGNRQMLCNTKLCDYYFERLNISKKNIQYIDVATGVDSSALKSQASQSIFYYVELKPKITQYVSRAESGFNSQYKKLCFSTIGYLDISKYGVGLSPDSNEKTDKPCL